MVFIFRNVLQGMGRALIPLLGGAVELMSRVVVAFIAEKQRSFEGLCYANATAWVMTAAFLLIAYIIIMRRLMRSKAMA